MHVNSSTNKENQQQRTGMISGRRRRLLLGAWIRNGTSFKCYLIESHELVVRASSGLPKRVILCLQFLQCYIAALDLMLLPTALIQQPTHHPLQLVELPQPLTLVTCEKRYAVRLERDLLGKHAIVGIHLRIVGTGACQIV